MQKAVCVWSLTCHLKAKCQISTFLHCVVILSEQIPPRSDHSYLHHIYSSKVTLSNCWFKIDPPHTHTHKQTKKPKPKHSWHSLSYVKKGSWLHIVIIFSYPPCLWLMWVTLLARVGWIYFSLSLVYKNMANFYKYRCDTESFHFCFFTTTFIWQVCSVCVERDKITFPHAEICWQGVW